MCRSEYPKDANLAAARRARPSLSAPSSHSTRRVLRRGTRSAIVVMRSTDGGRTFPQQTTVANSFGLPFLDKPWIACDTTGSPFDGRAYVEWSESFDLVERDIRVAASDDGTVAYALFKLVFVVAPPAGALAVQRLRRPRPGGEDR